jgi:uncharacterized membrane protein
MARAPTSLQASGEGAQETETPMPARASLRQVVAPRRVAPLGAVYALLVVASLPVYGDSWHLVLHVVGAVLLVGNVVVTALWMVAADFSGQDAARRFAARAVNLADLAFTVPSVILLTGNGMALAASRYGGWGGFWSTGWIVAGLGLLVATTVVWAVFLVPAQLRMAALANAAAPLGKEYDSAFRRWSVFGVIATVLPVIALILMVTKP